MINIELLINISARAAIGLCVSAAASLGFWWLMWTSYRVSSENLPIFFLVQALIIGGPAALGSIIAWWNTQSSRKINWLFIALVIATAVVSGWLWNEIRGVKTYYALFGGVLRVEVFSLRHMIVGMIIGAVVGGNAMGAVFYLYRALRHREY